MGRTWPLGQEAGWECGRRKKGSGSKHEEEPVYKPYEPTISGIIILAGPLLLKVP